jgi:hypothetical protein
LLPSQLVQFNLSRFSIPNRLAVNIFVQDFVNWRAFPISLSVNLSIFHRFRPEPGLRCKGTSLVSKSGQMLKIQRVTNGQVVFTLSGRMDADNLTELEGLIESETRGRCIVLELNDLTLVDRDAVRFLERCEAHSIKLENCPAYIREWIARERESK